MKFRMRHTAPVVIVAVALGAGSALLATSAGGGATDAKPSLARVATAESGESREQAGLASRSLVPEAWGAVIDYESLAAENGEPTVQAGLASGSLVPEAWGALIDYESLAAENGEPTVQAGLASGSLVPEAWGALIDYESLAAVAR